MILCTPVWLGGIPSPVRTFIKKYGQLVNKVEYIVTHKNEKKDYRKTMKEMDKLMGKVHVREAHVLITGKQEKLNIVITKWLCQSGTAIYCNLNIK